MLAKLGHKNFSLLGKMMTLHSARHRVMSENIANVNTPYYNRKEFNFGRSLNHAMSQGTATAYQGVNGRIDRPNNTPVRNNGNNVDIDMEIVAMKENSMLYQIYTELYAQKVGMVKRAIRGGRG